MSLPCGPGQTHMEEKEGRRISFGVASGFLHGSVLFRAGTVAPRGYASQLGSASQLQRSEAARGCLWLAR